MMTTKVRSLLFWDIFFFPNEQINAVSSDWLYGIKQKKSRFPLIAMRFLFVFLILVKKPKFVLQILKMNLANLQPLEGKSAKWQVSLKITIAKKKAGENRKNKEEEKSLRKNELMINS